MIWRMLRTNIYLEERQSELLDRLATEEGISRAELIRRMIDAQLTGQDRSLDEDLAAIAAAAGAMADLDAPDRRPDDRSDHLDRMWRIEG